MPNSNGKKNKSLRGNYLLPLIAGLLALAALIAALWLLFSQTNLFHGRGAVKPAASSAAAAASSGAQAASSAVAAAAGTSSYSGVSLQNESYFDNAVFVGDACTQGIVSYQILTKDRVIASGGLAVSRALSTKLKTESGSAKLLDALKAKNPAKVYILIGTNDLQDLSSADEYASYYGKLLDALKTGLPSAKIYAQSILPVTANYEAKHAKITNSRIDEFNEALKTVCGQKNAVYLDVASLFKGTDGKLPSASSTDGLNIRKKCYFTWLNYLSSNS